MPIDSVNLSHLWPPSYGWVHIAIDILLWLVYLTIQYYT
jgi:hypothetical protein